ncbi:MAG TPA: CinA family protein [Candidatus Methanomethylophilaceae archaeon]|nr:CinA family protein [Candidatus Methanomethylophilaceae archaeon]
MSVERVLELLTEQKKSIAIAESCTAGLASFLLTSIPGASSSFKGAVVAYANDIKTEILMVDPVVLLERGAVSEEPAIAMAKGIRGLMGADIGLAITGIAGPGGGTETKPVGLVHMAATDGKLLVTERRRFPGERNEVRNAAAQAALDLTVELLEME